MYHVYINTKQYTLKETTEIFTRFILASRLVFTIMTMTSIKNTNCIKYYQII